MRTATHRPLGRWILSLWLALVLAACGGGGGGDAAAVLAGDPAQPASTALLEKRSARVDKSDIVQGHLLTRLFVVFKADATVGRDINGLSVAGSSARAVFLHDSADL